MAERTIIVEHNGKKYTGHVGTVSYTRLGMEDHGILTADVGFEWPGGGVSVGGFRLDARGNVGTAYGLDYIIRVLDVFGVEKWENIKGSQAIVLFDYTEGGTWGRQSKGIAHITDDSKVFIPAEHAQEWRDRQEEN
jgi:hypothetical protein